MLARPPRADAAPPGVEPDAYHAALLDDVFELLDSLTGLEAAIAAAPPDYRDVASRAAWPTTPVLTVTAESSAYAVLEALHALGGTEAAVVADDAPDLPGLLVGKLFSGLSGAEVAACPADGGGLVALASRLPVPLWLRAAAIDLDLPDALAALSAAAPNPRQVAIVPGWHRLRRPEDVHRLDPGLEGWEATRRVLSVPRR